MKIHKRLIDLESPAEVVKQIVSNLWNYIVRMNLVWIMKLTCYLLHLYRPPCQSKLVLRLKLPVSAKLTRSESSRVNPNPNSSISSRRLIASFTVIPSKHSFTNITGLLRFTSFGSEASNEILFAKFRDTIEGNEVLLWTAWIICLECLRDVLSSGVYFAAVYSLPWKCIGRGVNKKSRSLSRSGNYFFSFSSHFYLLSAALLPSILHFSWLSWRYRSRGLIGSAGVHKGSIISWLKGRYDILPYFGQAVIHFSGRLWADVQAFSFISGKIRIVILDIELIKGFSIYQGRGFEIF